jgi:RNA ligase (TIGR02306 family)
VSDIAITVQEIREVENHPDADRLDIVKILGTQCIVGRDEYVVGDKVIYFPPDMMIPEAIADALGVLKYLKHVRWNREKVQSRIAACRLRGVPSYGFVIDCDQRLEIDKDVTALYMGEKYEPEINTMVGVGGRRFNEYGLPEGKFHRYTNLQHHWRYPNVFEPDENVIVTEKIHGTNSRLGVLLEDGEFVFAAGSHRVRWKDCPMGDRYWKPLGTSTMRLLNELCGESADVILFGEIYGSSVQDMNYGVMGDDGYRVFDISVNGRYLDWKDVVAHCRKHEVPTVPVLFEGPWSCVSEVIDELASGGTCVGESTNTFKGREGIVIKTAKERLTGKIGGKMNAHRATVKYVSADYLDRKDAQDNAQLG